MHTYSTHTCTRLSAWFDGITCMTAAMFSTCFFLSASLKLLHATLTYAYLENTRLAGPLIRKKPCTRGFVGICVCLQFSTSPHAHTSSSPSSLGDECEEGACERLGARFEIADQVDGVQLDERQGCPAEESVHSFVGVVVGGAESGEREENNGDEKNVDAIGEHEKCPGGFRGIVGCVEYCGGDGEQNEPYGGGDGV